MIDEFKSEMLNFIAMGGVEFPSPDVVKTGFNGEKISTSHYCYIPMGGGTAPVGFFLRHILTHSLLDAVFESEIPSLEDKGYRTKYKSLPESDDFEIAVKETYRILSFLRNVIVHNKSKLVRENGRISFSYKRTNRGKNGDVHLVLDIGRGELDILYSIAVMRSKLKGSVDQYHKLIISAMYESALAGIKEFCDEHKAESGTGIINIVLKKKINWRRRYRVISPPVEHFRDFIKFHRMPVPEEWAGDEYELVQNGCVHVIPGEVLGEDGRFAKSEIESWKSLNKVISIPSV